jgi:hypothetical protein
MEATTISVTERSFARKMARLAVTSETTASPMMATTTAMLTARHESGTRRSMRRYTGKTR